MKNKRKVKVFFTIDPDLHTDFDKHIDEKLLDKSKLIEYLNREYMNNEKNK